MILRRLAEQPVLLANFDPASVARAVDGVVDRVTDLEVGRLTPHTVVARAQVHGTGLEPYTTTVEAFADAGWTDEVVIEGWCTCPVRGQCKHAAALCLRLAEAPDGAGRGPAARPTWQDHLEAAIGGLQQAAAAPAGVPLALRVGLAGSSVVTLRPMQQGKRGWVQRGASWREVPLLHRSPHHDPAQVAALTALERTMSGRHWFGADERTVEDFGPQTVAALREAQRAGVELYADVTLDAVRLLDDPAPTVVDVVEDRQARVRDGSAHVVLGVDLAGSVVALHRLTTAGDPVHTVAHLDDRAVTIATLGTPLPAAVTRPWLRGPVTVPAGQRHDLPTFLRRLRGVVTVGSSDGSVPLPEPVPPRLCVEVAWRGASAATVTWLWLYGDPSAEQQCGLDAADDLGGLRDTAAEQGLRAGASDLDLTDRDVGGADVVSLGLLEIPAWRDRTDVEVRELDPPDLRPAEEEPSISLEVPEPDPVEGRPDSTDWLDLQVVVRVQGEEVPLPALITAVTLQQPFLVLPSGLYLPTDTPELVRLVEAVRAAAELRSTRDEPLTVAELLAMDDVGRVRTGRRDLGVLAALGDLAEADARAADWLTRARALRDLTEIPRPEPTGVTTELRYYQRDGFAWLAFLAEHGLGGILADDMGLGKTLQVLALIAHTRARGEESPFLVVAPTSVVGAWAEQAARHTPGLRVRAVTGTRSRRGESIADLADHADVVVTTYTLLRLGAEEYAEVDWAGLVLDEAQQVKNHKSQAFKAIATLRAPFRLAVTGTPFENRLRELWALLSIVAPGLYPRLARFTRSVAVPIEKHDDDAALQRFQQRIRPFLLRRTKDLVAGDLPPKQEQVLTVQLGARHRRLYDAHLAKERQRILGLLDDFDENRIEILAALTRLRQLSLDPALVDAEHDAVGSAKLDLLLEHLATVTAEGHRALVFSSFTGFLRRARARLEAAGLEVAYLDGSTTQRAEVIEAFRTGTAPVFLISLKAGGVGLTLTEADYVYVLDPWWNPAAEAQAVDRAHRIGQTSTVMVYRLVADDTIEEKVMALKARKAAVFAQVLDGGTSTDGQVTADDIRALFD